MVLRVLLFCCCVVVLDCFVLLKKMFLTWWIVYAIYLRSRRRDRWLTGLGSWELHLAGATYSRTPRTFETMVVIPYGIGIGIGVGIGIVGSWDWDHGI